MKNTRYPNQEKQIKVSFETWKTLSQIKLDNRLPSYEEVIRLFLRNTKLKEEHKNGK